MVASCQESTAIIENKNRDINSYHSLGTITFTTPCSRPAISSTTLRKLGKSLNTLDVGENTCSPLSMVRLKSSGTLLSGKEAGVIDSGVGRLVFADEE